MAGPLERARAGDIGAFVELVRRYDPELRDLAADEARIDAYVAAYRALPDLDPGAEPGEWLAGFVRRAPHRGEAGAAGGDLWARLAERLAAESPALAPPELPERRFPVWPSLQRRRRLKGPG
jgi:hypothetical protein